ncbi:MAG: hypothetical protein KatS3mg102_0641 [Planctomycetota bacterium]|nr:MAG: hypothetical protein KatS3mg102_0641 [Planctomycetota bacterium]
MAAGHEQTTTAATSGFAAALAHYREGRFAQALAELDALLARAPADAGAHYLRGIVLEESGEYAEAIAAFDRALALAPELERAYYHRGIARFLAGDRQGALSDLERAVACEPDFLFAVYNLGVVAAALRDWTRAQQAFARALELDPGNTAEYAALLVEIGRAAAQEETYAQGHRFKNMLAVLGDDYRALLAELERHEAAAPAGTAASSGQPGAPPAWRERAARIEGNLQQLDHDLTQFLRRRPPGAAPDRGHRGARAAGRMLARAGAAAQAASRSSGELRPRCRR